MRYVDSKTAGFTWHTVVIEGTTLRWMKFGSKTSRAVTDIFRAGSSTVAATTDGITKVDDMVVEFDVSGWVAFLAIFGVNDTNPTTTSFTGRVFEVLEYVNDPIAGSGNAGAFTNIYKGCQVVGLELSTEATEAATKATVTIHVQRAEYARGAAGGGVTL